MFKGNIFSRRSAVSWTSRIQNIKAVTRLLDSSNQIIQLILAAKWSILLLMMAFMLGRAMILEELAPFAIAYYAVLYFMRKELLKWVVLFLFLGSLFAVNNHSVLIIMEIVVFYLIQTGLNKYERSSLSLAPMIVFLSTFLVLLFSTMVQSDLTWYSLMLAAAESFLSFILTLIFIQAIPVITLTRKNVSLRSEEIICLIILLASVMTGTVGWYIGSLSIEHVLSRYLILMFALVGGAPMGASVGVVTGLILSLAETQAIYQMSLLAFAGLLAGILKEGKKMGVALGMLLGSSILSIYLGDQKEILTSTWESAAAVILFMLTARSVIATIAKYVPGTQENIKHQQDYAKRVRDITAGRVEQYSEMFQQLSLSFKQLSHKGQALQKEEDINRLMNAVVERSCAGCFKKSQCWEEKYPRTHKYMLDMMKAIEVKKNLSKKEIPLEWKHACVKTEQVLDIMKQQYYQYKRDLHWKKQIHESRELVADQLSGVSQVMDDLAKEIKREGQHLFVQEEQIRYDLERLGLSIHSIDIINLDVGNVEIEMVHQYTKGFDECRKIIAPLLSGILGENITVKSEQFLDRGEGYYTVMFGSAKEYEVETGIAGAAKGGDLLSGDSFSMLELGNGKFAVAISDGMGNGERARAESSTALSILHQLLQSGMEERLAIKSVNSVLLLRSTDEMFATIDVALIDLYNAQTVFMKIGSTPSFIKRGSEVIPISANNLPVGILHEIDVDLVRVQMQPGDTLIMMTDGIYDAPGHAVNKELWMKRIIQEIKAENPQEIADCLLETVFRFHHGEIEDDMTVVVAKLSKFKPEWATVHWPSHAQIARPKTVS